jgi:hypothetical protein
MRNEIKAILARLKEVEDRVELSHAMAENRGQEERQESLEAELEAIQEAIEALLDAVV